MIPQEIIAHQVVARKIVICSAAAENDNNNDEAEKERSGAVRSGSTVKFI